MRGPQIDEFRRLFVVNTPIASWKYRLDPLQQRHGQMERRLEGFRDQASRGRLAEDCFTRAFGVGSPCGASTASVNTAYRDLRKRSWRPRWGRAGR
jgi:hypothetical protein